MKITQAQIQMQSQHVYQHEQSKQESLKTWIGDERPTFDGWPAGSQRTHRARRRPLEPVGDGSAPVPPEIDAAG